MKRKRSPTNRRRQALYRLDHGRCVYCTSRVSSKTATLDHMVPHCLGGPSTATNLLTCCKPCNVLKADSTVGAFALRREELGYGSAPELLARVATALRRRRFYFLARLGGLVFPRVQKGVEQQGPPCAGAVVPQSG